MRKIDPKVITETVARLCIEANYKLPVDVVKALKSAAKKERGPSKFAVDIILKNIGIAGKRHIPICQDTGMAVVFLRVGRDVQVGGDLYKAVNEGVKRGYRQGYLRKSVVAQPFSQRRNTSDNSPAIIHYEPAGGNKIEITVMPKGFGSENVSRLKMFNPGEGAKGIEDFVLGTIKEKGANACPPLIVGIGVGGTSEKAMLLAKEALIRKVGAHNKEKEVAELEKRLYKKVNSLRIGPAGLGGCTTALAVNIETWPTHIAGLPVALNISCWALRYAKDTV